MFTPSTEKVETATETNLWDEVDLFIPEIDPENPELSAAPIEISDDENLELETQVID